MTSVAVAGASGYAGGELLRYLAQHPSLDLASACAAGRAGESLATVHPQFAGTPWAGMTLDETTSEILGAADLVFLALPHGESAALVAGLPAETLVVDLGADFRLADAGDWEQYYGGVHAGSWTYGLPEIPGARAAISGSMRVANPGCYPTAVALALAPLHAGGLIDASDITVVAASGTTGAGRKPSDGLLASSVMGSMSAYKVGGVHQHTPEMEQTIASVGVGSVRIGFTPYLAPMPRGIIATCTARSDASEGALRDALASAYEGEAFVTVLPAGVWPQTSSVFGTNAAQLQVARDEHTGRAVVISVIDNLGKGAAGQAIQNANLMLGLDEGAGLDVIGVAP